MTSVPPSGGQYPDPTSAPQSGQPFDPAAPSAPAPGPSLDKPAEPAGYPPPSAPSGAYPPPPAYGATPPPTYGATPSPSGWTPVLQPTMKAPPWAILAISAGVLALIGLFLPWFKPSVGDIEAEESIYAWTVRLGLIGPIVIAICALLWVKLMLKPSTRDEIDKTLRSTAIGGVVGLVAVVVSWFLVPSAYTDWDAAQAYADSVGESLSRGPQIGLWITALACIDALAAAALGYTMLKKNPAAAPGGPGAAYPAPGAGQPPYPGQSR